MTVLDRPNHPDALLPSSTLNPPRAISTRQILLALVFMNALPLLLLSIILLQEMMVIERKSVRDALMTSVVTMADLVDNEIDTHMAIARTLAESTALKTGDLPAFQQQARRAVEAVPGAWLGVSDISGRLVTSTLMHSEEAPPMRGSPETMARAWKSGTPQISDMFDDPVSKQRNALIEVPVFKGGAPAYSIVMGLMPNRFLALLTGKFGKDATVAIIDREHMFVARIPDHENKVGSLASASWRQAVGQSAKGLVENTTLEGIVSLTAYAPTREGWTVGISYPLAMLDASVGRVFQRMMIIGSVLLALSLLLGYFVARHIGLAMADLATVAEQVGRGEVITPKPLLIREAAAVQNTLSLSAMELARQKTALEASNNTFKKLVENSPFGIYVVDADFRLVLVGAGAQKVFEHIHPLIGRNFAEVLRCVWEEPFASEAIALFRRTLETGDPYRAPPTVKPRKDQGTTESYDWMIERLALPDGRPGVVCHFYDLSERERYETALRESEARFRSTFENAAVGVAHVALDGSIRQHNGRLAQILGYAVEEISSISVRELIHPDDLHVDAELLSELQSGRRENYAVDKRCVRKDGTLIWCGITISLQRDAQGEPQYFIAIVRDITERRAAQNHQRFLLRELAHRSKNQLAVLQAMAGQTARNSRSMDEFLTKFSQRIQGLAVATDVLVAQDWAGAPMNDLVERQLETFAPSRHQFIHEGEPISIDGDAAHAVGLALHELATNAVKYGAWSAPGGTVTVRWRVEQRGSPDAHVVLTWVERGGPPVVAPQQRGFGQIIIERTVAQKLGGSVELVFAPEGLSWALQMPASHVVYRTQTLEDFP
jgi:PAS domain S-box-containing protein